MRKAGIGSHLVEGASGTDEQLKSSDIERYIRLRISSFETPLTRTVGQLITQVHLEKPPKTFLIHSQFTP
jgi:hypothetical protein